MKIKLRIISLCLLSIVLTGLYFFLFKKAAVMTKYKEFITYSKKNFGGVVYNRTDQTVLITNYKYPQKLPPGKSSKDIGIFDADSLIITEPMSFENHIYYSGVLKFCDYSKLELTKNDGVIEIKAKNIWICKILNDFNFYNSLKEAFKKTNEKNPLYK